MGALAVLPGHGLPVTAAERQRLGRQVLLVEVVEEPARSLFGEAFTWSAAGVGYPAEYQLAALGIMLGGQMRVGLEDNLRLSHFGPRADQRRAGGEGRQAR